MLSGSIATAGITTTSGIYLEVKNFLDDRRYAASESYVGDHPWSEVRVPFETPPEAQAIILKIRRDTSQKLDNLIGGTAWIDRISLRRLD
ncbi:MAG: hypothetical protein F9K13_12710 [Candidatus Methylomirabilis oxygeniifera]|nr:MAG: hypothetical protein F9K13_12710 [Candidatus Methylomirabilis oxyfera]